MSDFEKLPPADTPGTGWRISENSGRRWYRIERGSREFMDWMQFYRKMGKQSFANFTIKHGHTFVMGPSPNEGNYGSAQLAFMQSQNIGGQS